MAELPRAAFWPDRTVRVAAAMLPTSVRARYEREFLSELFGLSTWRQTRYALDILINIPRLGFAVRRHANASKPSPVTLVAAARHRPLPCRLNVHHQWARHLAADGGRYLRCRRCGIDRTEVDHRVRDTSAGSAVIGVIGFNGGAGY